jgi:phytol kinase
MGLLSGQPWWLQQTLGVTAVALWLALLIVSAMQLRRLSHEQGSASHKREWSRKLLHIGTGAVVPLAWLLGIDRLIAIPAAAAITVVAAVNHRTRLLPAIEDVGRHSYGTVAYGASITVLLALFWPARADAVCAGVLVMALGDGFAGVIGSWIQSPSWSLFGHRKSIAGTAVMATTAWLVLILLAAFSQGAGAMTAPGLIPLLAIALIATLLEQLAWLGLDNLTVPIVSGWLWASWQ